MLHRIRETFVDIAPDVLCGVVEADEALVGGKNKNRPVGKRFRNSQGRSARDKMGVVGLLQREGKVMNFVTGDLSGPTIEKIVRENVVPSSILVTDDYTGYKPLAAEYHHVVLKHKDGGFVKQVDGERYHTQNMEGYWTLLKKAYSHYHYISPKHLQRYCNECVFRYDRRKLKDPEKFEDAIKRCAGRKLPYARLTANVVGKPRFLQASKTSL
jgi:transposase-like protein